MAALHILRCTEVSQQIDVWVKSDRNGLSRPCPVYPPSATSQRTSLEVRFVP